MGDFICVREVLATLASGAGSMFHTGSSVAIILLGSPSTPDDAVEDVEVDMVRLGRDGSSPT
jgi:hypothetical protein